MSSVLCGGALLRAREEGAVVENDRNTYLHFLARIVGHAGVAEAFAEGAAKHRRLEEDFNRRLLETCPSPSLLSFPHMELAPEQYWQRNFFSILFLSIFDAVGISPSRQHLYGMLLHAVRGIVTATDNILDEEAKGSVRIRMQGKVLPNVLVTLIESGVLHEVLRELCTDSANIRRTWGKLTEALFALGGEESEEEHAIEEVLPPKRLLDEIHRFRGGGLLLLAFVAPEINEPQLADRIRVAQAGVNHIGLSLQILDDLSDFEEDLRDRNHNMLRSWVVWQNPEGRVTDADLSALRSEVLRAPEQHFATATRQVMEVAIEMALRGFELLHQVDHPVDRSAGLRLIAAMFKLRGLERLWDFYEREPVHRSRDALDCSQYFPASDG